MSIYTSNYFKNLSRNKNNTQATRILLEHYLKSESFDIFLSHSFLDKEEVEGIYIELTSIGFTVYVDWMVDPELDRSNVTKQSAALVRQRMKSSRALVLAISTNASTSKWMPWELGFMDGYVSKCAIIPVSKDDNPPKDYKGFEYLTLYPFIKKVGQGDSRPETLFVINDAYEYVTFGDWLSSNKLPHYQSINIFTR
jgi:hypothetical protein